MKKKFTSFIAMCLAMGMTMTNVFAVNFTDVPENHWAYNSIEKMQQQGIMVMNSKGEFKPNEKINYFEFMEIFANAAGYKNPEVVKDMDPKFREAILKNQEQQMPKIEKYMEQYEGWYKLANEEIAYLLGRGYITDADLQKFMVKNSEGNTVKKMLTKQDLATYIVRLLQKEETAKANFKKAGTTGFKDENLMDEGNKANIAYLKEIGLVRGDGENKFGANAFVTRAICAKMLSDGLEYKSENVAGNNEVADTKTYKLKKVVDKNEEEYYVLLNEEEKTKFYTMKKETPVKTKDGKTVKLTDVDIDSDVVVKTGLLNNVEYIMEMTVSFVSDTEVDKEEETSKPEEQTRTVHGVLERIGSNDDISITDTSDRFKTYMLDSNAQVIKSGKRISLDDVALGSKLKLTVKGDVITQVEVLEDATVSGEIEGEITKKTLTAKGLELEVKTRRDDYKVFVPEDVTVKRNGKTAELSELRLGDVVTIENKDGEVSRVEAESIKGRSEGRVKALFISAKPQITIETSEGEKTFNVINETEIYDNNSRENISLREIKLGQKVEIMLDSKEVLSIIVQEGSTKVNYKATIESVGEGNKSIDVIIDFDPLTEEKMVFRRISVPVEVKIEKDGKDEHRSVLKKGMEVIITFENNEGLIPEKILVLN